MRRAHFSKLSEYASKVFSIALNLLITRSSIFLDVFDNMFSTILFLHCIGTASLHLRVAGALSSPDWQASFASKCLVVDFVAGVKHV